jgi:hypothetical protein
MGLVARYKAVLVEPGGRVPPSSGELLAQAGATSRGLLFPLGGVKCTTSRNFNSHGSRRWPRWDPAGILQLQPLAWEEKVRHVARGALQEYGTVVVRAGRAVPCRAVPCRAVPCRAVPSGLLRREPRGCMQHRLRSNTEADRTSGAARFPPRADRPVS